MVVLHLKPYYPIAATVQRLIQHTAASVITLLRVQDYSVEAVADSFKLRHRSSGEAIKQTDSLQHRSQAPIKLVAACRRGRDRCPLPVDTNRLSPLLHSKLARL